MSAGTSSSGSNSTTTSIALPARLVWSTLQELKCRQSLHLPRKQQDLPASVAGVRHGRVATMPEVHTNLVAAASQDVDGDEVIVCPIECCEDEVWMCAKIESRDRASLPLSLMLRRCVGSGATSTRATTSKSEGGARP
eukprot:CAMPEP_0177572882 /NCGR_PEP_ID=MMETSP0369-20130122/78245_1 /TAXON_ID=447022 ORGANISM="Scrippsiella hangoei-like, Strain SHHI-4" /NCGR_SAMPLE_ID=MMETSP0369 /ASSEMBLY_ACC=CAM_ASM_000364 /LENGTH=137 /DNA_ID=CAMNT_0019060985 /DNA_START=44 /DNA_END=458 /DNA_ORIENTATION=-